MTTLADIRDEIRIATGRENIDSLINRKINAAYIELAFMARIPDFLDVRVIPTIASTPNYALSADEFAPLSIRDTTNKRHPTPIEFLQFDELDPTTPGIPAKWVVYKNELLFHPTPNGIFNMRMRVLKRPIQLTDAAPTIVTPFEWDEALSLLALYKVTVVVGDEKTAAIAKDGYTSALSVLRIRETVIKEHMVNQGLAWGSER